MWGLFESGLSLRKWVTPHIMTHGFLKFVLYQKFTAENAGFAEFFKLFSAFFALSAVKALFVSTLRKPCIMTPFLLTHWSESNSIVGMITWEGSVSRCAGKQG